jgi:hypothetical protein
VCHRPDEANIYDGYFIRGMAMGCADLLRLGYWSRPATTTMKLFGEKDGQVYWINIS